MRSPFVESPEFLRLLNDEGRPDLLRVALEIARDAYPQLDPGPYLERVDALADRARDRVAAADRPRQALGQINWVLFVEEGFRGNTDDYYDPRNSYLNDVLDRKTGIPISLAVLYWRLAERLGLPVSGVNLPAHFVLKVGEGESSVYVDPFHSGALLDREGCRRLVARLAGPSFRVSDEHLAPCPPTVVVARMLRNLKSIYVQNHEYASAVPVQRRLAAVLPGEPEEQRDLGTLLLRVGRPAEALDPLETYLRARPAGDDAGSIRHLLRAARREVALWN